MRHLERNTTHRRRVIDRFPDIRAAGKALPTEDRSQGFLQEVTPRPVTPPVIKKFLNTTRPEPGKIRVFYGKADDPDVASALIHGLRTKGSTPGGLVINPKPKTLYQQKWQQLQEAVYFSSKNAPLERSHDQSAGLPKGLDTERTTFGVKSVQFINAGEIVNPTKTVEQVEKEAEEGHQLYIKSHNAYFVGERVDRKYNWSRIGKDHRFGVPTPNYSDGRKAAGSLQWLAGLIDGKLVSKQCDDFRERTQPQIGKVHDPIADTMNVPENHTFGILFRTDGFGVGDLLNSPLTADYTSDPDKWWSLVTAVRQDLKKANFNKFSALLQTFSRYDKSGQGFIDKKDLHNVCLQFNLDLNTPVLESLVEFCEDSKDGQINFMEFTNVLNWKKEIPAELVEQIRAKAAATGDTEVSLEALGEPRKLEHPKPVDVASGPKATRILPQPKTAVHHAVTSSPLIQGVVGGPSTANVRTYGIPTVRTDLTAPQIKRIGDWTNYGDQSTAYGLLYPTRSSLKGVYEEHYLASRTREEIAQIFRSADVTIHDELFEEAWKLASMRHPKGEVCVESFRNALKEIQAY
uniref:EF-hand domain-containing protein n=1 Tax=Scleropages formosus TaxID=113540 RepID=A0A8C9TDW8_SCLFO